MTHQTHNQQGMIVVAIMGIMIFLSIIIIGMFGLSNGNVARAKGRILALQAQYSAESGVDAAIATLNSGNTSYAGTSSEVQVLSASTYRATYTVTVSAGSNAKERVLDAVGRVYLPKSATTASYTRKVRVVTQRSATTTASSIMSRNILAIDSAVKNVRAKDIFVNGYITMNKNVTNLIAENITVAGKNTGATNCSIGGSGNLVKPSSFTNSGQTKTNITVAYNNCITPPGNASNTDFNVAANQGNITTVQSTYIPWSAYMDNTYSSATNGCNDWTSGASVQTIPKTIGSKQTQYPDSGSNISTSCGSNGDLALGSTQYNITDNVHIRASLCAASACTPTFYNPDSTMKYVFVEGSINFDAVQTASGSGPIALIAYGADPASKTGVCPYGGSVYIGNGGTTLAPALYMLATNGICFSKTKFSTDPALGGVGGKNIYLSNSPGQTFALGFDPSYPVSQIPTDLAWRAVRYQRIL
ncbi:MAG: hypothetical protein ACHQTE_02400 [Candidatus Saccharimonadales bacterium]